MNWQEHYRSRTISADEAAAMVKPGMRVDFPLAAGTTMQRALAARGKQMDGVIDLRMSSPLIDPGWMAGEVAAHFRIEFELFIGNMGRAAHDSHLATYLPNLFSTGFKPHDERPAEDKPIDFVFVNVTTPNAKGFVSFGPHQWNKRMYARRARHAIAEVDASMTRTYGDVYMHVSEFEYFVEGTPPRPDRSGHRTGTGHDGCREARRHPRDHRGSGSRAYLANQSSTCSERRWRICVCCSALRRRPRSSKRSRDT